MVDQDPNPKSTFRPLSNRRRVNAKILRFSLAMGALGLTLTIFVYSTTFYDEFRSARTTNQRTLSEIRCTDFRCDSSAFTTDQETGPDYILDSYTRYFLETPVSSNERPERFPWLDFTDIGFIRKFHQPMSFGTPDFETWRLYSRQATLSGRTAEVVVGYQEKGPSKMIDTPPSLLQNVDDKLKAEADKIAENLARSPLPAISSKFSADGFAIAYADTEETVLRGPWLPAFFPESKLLPTPGIRFYVAKSELYGAESDTNGRLTVTSVIRLGDLWQLLTIASFTFFTVSVVARWLARRFLRNYFAISDSQVPSLADALRSGESQRVEFKRGFPLDEHKTDRAYSEFLESIAAFGNTNDGAIFLGVDDTGVVKGLQLDYKKRDLLEQRIRTVVRNHVKPAPPFQVTFEEVKGLLVARIAVARGTAPAYLLHGVIYIRDGSSDIQAQPEHLSKLMAEYSF